MEDIADIALNGRRPPNFNDQCAAFIASDIKNAIHEGIAHEDIVGGLVYSICMNYSNRVKGNRPVGEKVFMQGGVCYNKAVPLAMASLVGKPIIVPPEPGLMGAFGVALEVKKRIESGLSWTDGPHRMPEDVDPLVREQVRVMARDRIESAMEGRMLREPAINRLSELEVPMLVVVGELDVPGILEIADLLVDADPNADLVVVPGVAHMVNLEKPEEFNRILLDFLERF